jgi:hypothetical protein
MVNNILFNSFENNNSILILFIVSSFIIWLFYILFRKNNKLIEEEHFRGDVLNKSSKTVSTSFHNEWDFIKVGETYLCAEAGQIYRANILEDLSTEDYYRFKIRIEKNHFGEPPKPYCSIGLTKIDPPYYLVAVYNLGEFPEPSFWKWEFQNFQLEFDFDEFKLLLSDKIKREYVFAKDKDNKYVLIGFFRKETSVNVFFVSSNSFVIYISNSVNESIIFRRAKNNLITFEINALSVHVNDINERYRIVKTNIMDRVSDLSCSS